jgi:hypothetical protein
VDVPALPPAGTGSARVSTRTGLALLTVAVTVVLVARSRR